MRVSLHSLSCGATLSLSCLLFTGVARAEVKPYPSCERDPTESDVSAAKGAYEAGQVSFQEADYERALLYWEDAFRRDCTAVKLLLNIARAYELSGDLEAAVNALQTYVDRRPDAKDRSSVEKRIAKLQERIDAEAEKAAAAPVESEEPEKESEQAEPHVAPGPEASPREMKRPVWPIVITGTGVALAAAGHTVALIQQGKIEKRRDEIGEEFGCTAEDNQCPEDNVSAANEAFDNDPEATDLKEKRDAGTSLAGLGHLMGITGGVLWWILWTQYKSPEKAADANTYFQPVVAPGYQGLSFSGRF